MQLIPLLRDDLLVGRDDVLAALERREQQVEGRLVAANDLDHETDLRIVEDRERVAGDRDVASVADLLRVAYRRPEEPHRAAGRRVDALRAVGERTPDGASDGAQSEQPDPERLRGHAGTGRPQTIRAATRRVTVG